MVARQFGSNKEKIMTSAIDATKPVTGSPTTQSVRENFAAAKGEIEALQALNSGGRILQVVQCKSASLVRVQSSIPCDDTVPQITEGYELLSQAFTPLSASSVIMIEAVLNCSPAGSDHIAAALFQAGTNDALIAAAKYLVGDCLGQIIIGLKVASNNTTQRTYSIRAGRNTYGYMSMNGYGANRLFGSVCFSSLTLTEISG
jgi:hypothetical protein